MGQGGQVLGCEAGLRGGPDEGGADNGSSLNAIAARSPKQGVRSSARAKLRVDTRFGCERMALVGVFPAPTRRGVPDVPLMLNAVADISISTEQGRAGGEQAFPSWSYNWLLELILYRLNLPVYVLPFLVLAIYWLAPLVMSLWEGTALSGARAEALVQFLGQLGLPERVIGAARQFAHQQRFHAADSLPYLQDANHFLFTATLALGAVVGALTLKNFDCTVLGCVLINSA